MTRFTARTDPSRWLGAQIAHPQGIGGQPALLPIVVNDIRRIVQVIGPEANLIVIATLVAAFLSVESRRCRVAGKYVDDLPIWQPDGDIPVTL